MTINIKYTFRFGLLLSGLYFLILISCSNEESSKRRKVSNAEKEFYDNPGIGPVKELLLDDLVNPAFSAEGEKIFQSKCITCHKISEERGIGPGLKGVTLRRRPEWIMNQILNPLEMTRKDSLSKELFMIYQSQMSNMDLTEGQARSVLEYFREMDKTYQ